MKDLEGITTYEYDGLSRLTEVAYPDGEIVTYAYDLMGNRKAMTSTISGVVTYTYDAGDRLLAAGPLTFAWDDNGNMISKGSCAYTYDALNRLTGVVSGTTTVQFVYDGDGARVGKTVNGVATTYIQDPMTTQSKMLAQTTTGQTSMFIYGSDLLVWLDPTGEPVFYHADGLGSIRALSNLGGQLTDVYSYDSFGALRAHSGGADQPFAFTGEQLDVEPGLIFLRTRYYDPTVGRFSSSDSFPGFISDDQSLNRFPYAQNNPVLLRDDEGEFVITGLAIAIAAVSAYSGWKLLASQAASAQENLAWVNNPDNFEDPNWRRRYAKSGEEYLGLEVAGVKALRKQPHTILTGPAPGYSGRFGPSLYPARALETWNGIQKVIRYLVKKKLLTPAPIGGWVPTESWAAPPSSGEAKR
jgi:RHS repeat-associated protein